MTRERAGDRNVEPAVGDAYQLLSRLGGSRSPVFSAVALVDGSEVTVRLFPGLANGALEALQARVEIARGLRHIGLASTLDFGMTASGIPYVVTELVKGPPLDDWLEQAGIPPLKTTLNFMQCTCSALLAARQVGLRHARFWPRNIIVAGQLSSGSSFGPRCDRSSDAHLEIDDGLHCKLLDLPLLGPPTPDSLDVTCAHFVAPERLPSLTRGHTGPSGEVSGAEPSEASTLYGLGALMYHLCTGETPFRASRVRDLARAHTEQVLVAPSRINPELSKWLDEVMLRCLEFEPGQRYADLHTLAAAIDGLVLRQTGSSGTYPKIRV